MALLQEGKPEAPVSSLDRLNLAVERSWVGRYFCLKQRHTKLTTELRAGTVTFLTLAYVLAVNGAIVADTGGNCTANDCTYNRGIPGCQFGEGGVPDPGFAQCRERMKRSMTSATAVASMVACTLMGLIGNLPFAIAPGMGMNAFFTYTVVGFYGMNGMLTYPQALAACFIEGWIAFLISISGMRGTIVKSMPNAVMLATSGGIGFFLAFIGLQTANGIGAISYEPATLVTLGGCPIENRAYMYIIPDPSQVCVIDPATGVLVAGPEIGSASTNYYCMTNRMRSPSLWLGICGGMLMVLLMGRGFKGAIVSAILFVTFISWIPGHGASYLGASSQIPFGEEREAYFKKVVEKPNTSATDLSFDFAVFADKEVWAALFSFLYLDFLDTTGTFYSMATYINKKMPGFIDPVTKEFPRITAAFCIDATAAWIGALLGIPPLTTYIESATGIREGGRTGITALMTGFYFFLAMFFTPIIASIPPYATGPALILVGALMVENLLDIEWRDPQQGIPAFLTVAIIPMTYSVAYGIIAGLASYIILYILFLLYDLITAPLCGVPVADVLQRHKPNVLKQFEPHHQHHHNPANPDAPTSRERAANVDGSVRGGNANANGSVRGGNANANSTAAGNSGLLASGGGPGGVGGALADGSVRGGAALLGDGGGVGGAGDSSKRSSQHLLVSSTGASQALQQQGAQAGQPAQNSLGHASSQASQQLAKYGGSGSAAVSPPPP